MVTESASNHASKAPGAAIANGRSGSYFKVMSQIVSGRFAFVLVTTLLLAACSTAQPSVYAPMASRDGYAEESLGKGLYRVAFQGNGVTSKERVQNYCLYRAAELTLAQGSERFAVHDKETKQFTQVTRDYYDGWGYPYYGRRSYYRPYPGPPSRSERTTFRAELTIEPFSGPGTPGDSETAFQVYEAQAVVDQFAPQIVRPQDQPQ